MITLTMNFKSMDEMLAALSPQARPFNAAQPPESHSDPGAARISQMLQGAANDDQLPLPLELVHPPRDVPAPTPLETNEVPQPKRRGRKPKDEQAQPAVADNTGSNGPVASPGESSQDDVAVPAEADVVSVQPDAASSGGVTATLDEVNAAARKLIATKGLPGCISLLRSFGSDTHPVGRISQLQPKDYGAFIAAAEKACI